MPNRKEDTTNADIEYSHKEKEALNELDDAIQSSENPDIKCGYGCGSWMTLQKFANETTFIVIFGITGCVMSMTYAYFNGTITTLEKRFHLSSRSIGITQMGCDFTQMVTSLLFIHYITKKHRPRWMAAGVITICLFCLLITMPHWLYGAGEDALKLTVEFGGSTDENFTNILTLAEDTKNLCHHNATIDPCKAKSTTNEDRHPMLMLFMAQMISGFGFSLYHTLGYAYMDDNVEKSKTASMFSFATFLNMLGPSCGYTIASFCLRLYVSPILTPVINNKDPRWIGAWWMGWLIFGGLLFIFAFFLGMFPKELPANYKRKLRQNALQTEKLLKVENKKLKSDTIKEEKAAESNGSMHELFQTFKRIITNKIFMCNNIASIFYFFGYMPYWIFTPKYLEIVFRQSAAESNVYTGTVALVFTAIGVLASGAIISRKKPPARVLAGWNAITGLLTVVGFFSYSLIGCPGNENSLFFEQPELAVGSSALGWVGCVDVCHCDFVPYAPVCGENNLTYISACHAGCKGLNVTENGGKIYYDCNCIRPSIVANVTFTRRFVKEYEVNNLTIDKMLPGGTAVPGACPVDCYKNFLVFLVLMCSLKFIGSSTRASYFLIQVRSVAVEDKTVALGLGMVMVSLLSFMPSPVFFGWLLDRMCLVWGKTCSEKSNCWLYDAKRLRYTLNYTASIFFVIGALCDCVNCYLVKDLKIFDDDEKKTEDEKIGSNLELAKFGGNI